MFIKLIVVMKIMTDCFIVFKMSLIIIIVVDITLEACQILLITVFNSAELSFFYI